MRLDEALAYALEQLNLRPGAGDAHSETSEELLRLKIGRCRTNSAASVLQASGFRSDATVFRLNARSRPKTGSEPAFRRNTAACVYTIEAAPLLQKPRHGAFLFSRP
jgi:hypothetical protein